MILSVESDGKLRIRCGGLEGGVDCVGEEEERLVVAREDTGTR